MSRDQPRWPEGTPVAPSGRGPGGGRFRAGGWVELVASRVPGGRPKWSARGWTNDEAGRVDLARVAQQIRAVDQEVIVQNDDSDVEHVIGQLGAVVLSGGETAFTYRWDLPDGRSVVHKRFAPVWELEPDAYYADFDWDEEVPADPDPNYEQEQLDQARAEIVASQVAEAIGAPVPPVIPDPSWPVAVWVGYVDGLESEASTTRAVWEQQVNDSDQAWLIGLLDLLIANNDRYGNWIVDRRGFPVAIDHGQTMGMNDRLVGQIQREEIDPSSGSRFAGFYVESDWTDDGSGARIRLAWKPNRLHPDDINVAIARLTKLAPAPFFAPDEDGILTPDELSYMLAILEKLRPHAKGTRRLIP